MRSKVSFRPPSPAIVIALIALFVGLGGTSYAVISGTGVPDSQGVFHACVNRANGAIRIVTNPTQCHKPRGKGKHRSLGEFAVAWSQTGPKGPPGTGGGSINGVAAGGDLTGTYPNPAIAAQAVTPGKIGSIPAAVVTNTTDTSIPSSASNHTVLSFDTDQLNVGGVHSTTTNPSRLTAPIDGLYEVHGEASWSGCGSSSFVELEIYLNNFASRVGLTAVPVTASACGAESVSALVHLHAGDYVILTARQITGSAATVRGTTFEGAPDSPEFDMHWVGPS